MSEVGKEYNFPMIAGEANSMGLATLQELTELNYPNLFYRDENRTKLGWWTDQNSKERALIDLDEALVNGILTIRYKPAIDELMSFQRLQGRTGKVEFKGVGTHDDLVMALAIAYQVIKDQSAPTKSKFKSILTRRSTAGIR
jgi:hypothetical protein